VVNFVVPVTRDERLWEGAAADDFPRLRVGLPLLRARLSDEPLVIDHAAADVADHDAVLLPAAATGDALLVHDVFADACAVDDFTVEIRVFVKTRPKCARTAACPRATTVPRASSMMQSGE
jgi:hypothetical protein